MYVPRRPARTRVPALLTVLRPPRAWRGGARGAPGSGPGASERRQDRRGPWTADHSQPHVGPGAVSSVFVTTRAARRFLRRPCTDGGSDGDDYSADDYFDFRGLALLLCLAW